MRLFGIGRHQELDLLAHLHTGKQAVVNKLMLLLSLHPLGLNTEFRIVTPEGMDPFCMVPSPSTLNSLLTPTLSPPPLPTH